ncbi:DUF1572 family protein [Arundinibacter roseus]|uniref:DUF1572 domain-containing protein n=1 Tax=Arundinibacter roseus TaxID=2070510 RepID=A0A4R4K6H8_9BACT|nr:DUF1572 family protein [Arundinibacter roseus]TDB62272.1 DUF1572 domain-containing protein [Arundinibacter roseus]
MKTTYLESAIGHFEAYKKLGERTLEQLSDEELFWQYNVESNSIASIVKHLWGNMLSRWTDFLTTDGEKPWRQREAEFDNDTHNREQLMTQWNDGWNCLLSSLQSLTEEDLSKSVLIRNEQHSVVDAINRQLAHYASHVGQLLFIGKMLRGAAWISPSIPRGDSEKFNAEKFANPG